MKIAGPVDFPSKVKAGERFKITVPVDGNLSGVENEVEIAFESYMHERESGKKGTAQAHYATQHDYKAKLDPSAKTVTSNVVFSVSGHRTGSFKIKYKSGGTAFETDSHSVGAFFIE